MRLRRKRQNPIWVLVSQTNTVSNSRRYRAEKIMWMYDVLYPGEWFQTEEEAREDVDRRNERDAWVWDEA